MVSFAGLGSVVSGKLSFQKNKINTHTYTHSGVSSIPLYEINKSFFLPYGIGFAYMCFGWLCMIAMCLIDKKADDLEDEYLR
jgi:hypothetical protein